MSGKGERVTEREGERYRERVKVSAQANLKKELNQLRMKLRELK